MRKYEVAIIGASIAGATLAVHLGRLGISVVIFDSDTFPRRKSCGEGLAFAGLEVLKSFHPDLPNLGGCRLSGYELQCGGNVLAVETGPAGGISVERYHLDNLLLSGAANCHSVSFFENQKVREIQGRGPFILRSGKQTAQADFLVYANGAPVSGGRGSQKKRFGASTHWEGELPARFDKVGIFLYPGYEIYLTPLQQGRVNAAILSSKAPSLKKSGMRQLMSKQFLQLGFKLKPVDDLMGFSLVSSSRSSASEGRICRVGDACEVFDPIGGMGMTHALLSASALALSLSRAVSSPSQSVRELRQYSVRQSEIARPLRGFTRLIFHSLVSPGRPVFKVRGLVRHSVPLLSLSLSSKPHRGRFLGRAALSLIGL